MTDDGELTCPRSEAAPRVDRAAPPFRFGPRAVESPSPGTPIAMIRTPLLCATVFVGLAACAGAQRRPAAPVRSDTGLNATHYAPQATLSRILASLSLSHIGPYGV